MASFGQKPHAIAGRRILDGHHGIGAGVQDFPGQMGDLPAGQPPHDRIQLALDRNRMAGLQAGHPAGRSDRFDQDGFGPPGPVVLPELRRGGRRHAADAGLQEHMAWRAVIGQLADGLGRHHRVALGDVAWRDFGDVVGGVGDDVPALLLRGVLGFTHRIVVTAGVAAHLGPKRGDGGFAALAHRLVDENDAKGAEHLRPPGHRPAMIAIGGGGDGQARSGFGVAPGQKVIDGDLVRPGDRGQLAHQHAGDGKGAPQRLEAQKSEPVRLVLVVQACHPGGARQTRQGQQRREAIAGPGADDGFCGGKAACVQHLALGAPIGGGMIRRRIEAKPGGKVGLRSH